MTSSESPCTARSDSPQLRQVGRLLLKPVMSRETDTVCCTQGPFFKHFQLDLQMQYAQFLLSQGPSEVTVHAQKALWEPWCSRMLK